MDDEEFDPRGCQVLLALGYITVTIEVWPDGSTETVFSRKHGARPND